MPVEQLKIIKEYGLDESTSFERIYDGVDNNTYLLTESNGNKYILRESKRNNDSKSVDFELNLLRLLSQSSLTVPGVVVSKSNNYFVVANNKCFTIFNYINGHQFEIVISEMLSDNIIALGGKKLGELHSATRQIDIGMNPSRTIFTEFDRFLSMPIKKLAKFDGYEEFLQYAEKFRDDAYDLVENKKVESSAIHNDYRIQNLIFSEENTDASIIDFDWSCQGPLLKDIGLAIAEWSIFDFNQGPSREAIKQFIAGYNSTGPINVKYDSELLFWICFSCLSDTCTFFTDVLESRHDDLSIDRIEQCRMYKKFQYFKKELVGSKTSHESI